jgi:hypothetical protein
LSSQQQVDFMLGAAAVGNHACPTPEDIRALSPQQISDMYATYVSTLSAGLAELSSGAVAGPVTVAGVEQLAETVVGGAGCGWHQHVALGASSSWHADRPVCCTALLLTAMLINTPFSQAG